MLAEKLFLHVLIILVPTLLISVFFEKKSIRETPYLHGFMQGIAAFLCMIFPYYHYGLYWDLRYVPLVFAFLYGGPVAGGIVFSSILLARTVNGGDALIFGYISAVIALIGPLLFSKGFMKRSPKSRMIAAMFVGWWPTIVMLGIFISYILIEQLSVQSMIGPLKDLFIFFIIQVIAVGLVSIVYETILERNYMKKEMRRAEKLNTLGELAASIAHEVRNPLTVIKGFLQLMEKKERNENAEYLSIVLTELARAEAIINDYLNFAKPQFEKLEKHDLSVICQEVVLLLQPMATKQGVSLMNKLDHHCELVTDKGQLKQALVNILKNAIEATDTGGQVSVTLQNQNGMAKISISDTGKGMDKEQLSRIGTLFYTTKDKGTGLGTMVTIRIIEKMEGKIKYNSVLGKGTDVTVTLPLNNFTVK
ncbi:ATP-binding protein [Bacillus spongiae]|uniref:histidine kinase n=1 Tax=Bacillus spongiae TaxID=2683610 RepID=A0ABU8HIP1_9BACI